MGSSVDLRQRVIQYVRSGGIKPKPTACKRNWRLSLGCGPGQQHPDFIPPAKPVPLTAFFLGAGIIYYVFTAPMLITGAMFE
jgi:hypothetical protein